MTLPEYDIVEIEEGVFAARYHKAQTNFRGPGLLRFIPTIPQTETFLIDKRGLEVDRSVRDVVQYEWVRTAVGVESIEQAKVLIEKHRRLQNPDIVHTE